MPWAVDLMEKGFNPARHIKGGDAVMDEGIADRINAVVRARWQPQVRKRRRKQAATTTGITVETRARFGYAAPIGTTDDGPFRRLTVHLPASYAQRLFDARDAGANDQQMREIIAAGFKDVYSRTAVPALWDSRTSLLMTLTIWTWTAKSREIMIAGIPV